MPVGTLEEVQRYRAILFPYLGEEEVNELVWKRGGAPRYVLQYPRDEAQETIIRGDKATSISDLVLNTLWKWALDYAAANSQHAFIICTEGLHLSPLDFATTYAFDEM